MKKILYAAMLIFGVIVILSCASKPPANPDDEFKKVYHQFRDGLILDEAGKYAVKSGDTLSRIAVAQYGEGNGYFFPIIMLASHDIV